MPERITWTEAAWDDYTYWLAHDKKTIKRINQLIRDAALSPFSGIGKPELLRENLSGIWSRRIDDTHRLVYTVNGSELVIIACRYHYG